MKLNEDFTTVVIVYFLKCNVEDAVAGPKEDYSLVSSELLSSPCFNVSHLVKLLSSISVFSIRLKMAVQYCGG